MADLATKKIKIVNDGQIPANTSAVHAKLIYFLQLRGAAPDLSAATFQIADESHTIGNALRWMVMKKWVAAYSYFIVPACSPPVVPKLNSVATGNTSVPLSIPQDNAALMAGPSFKLNGVA